MCCQFTLTAVTILRQFEAGPTAPAGVGSWAVQTQLAWAQVSHHALIYIWTQSIDTFEYKLPSLASNEESLPGVIISINNHRMSTLLSFELSYLQTVGLTSFFFYLRTGVSLCCARMEWMVPEVEGSTIQLWCDVWKRYFGILGSDKEGGVCGLWGHISYT